MGSVPCKDRNAADIDFDSRDCGRYALPLEGDSVDVFAVGRSMILVLNHMYHFGAQYGGPRAARSLAEVGKTTFPSIC